MDRDQKDLLWWFMKRTEGDFKAINEKIDALATNITGLKIFEAKVLTVVAILVLILSPAVTLLTLWLKAH